jgi:fluoride exporter
MTALDIQWVGLGGGLGSLLRWWVGRAVGERYRGEFPLGTLLINISGAFPMGFLSVLFAVDWHTRHGTALNALCLTGIIGGYTTFSSMQMDAVRLAGAKGNVRAASYLLLSIVAGLLAAGLGGAFARLWGSGDPPWPISSYWCWSAAASARCCANSSC